MSSRRHASARWPPRAASSTAGAKHMFERLEPVIPDPILALMAAYRADPDPRKVDLGVGVYRDQHGQTPIFAAVRQAESALLASQATKTYVSSAGNADFN